MSDDFDLKQMEQETEEMLQFHVLNRENAVFTRTEGGFVALDVEGKHYDRIQAFRSFPFTDPDRYISIRDTQEKPKEIGLIEDLNRDVEPETAALLQEQLEMRYFLPKITKIHSIKDEFGYAYFDVDTDRGASRFTIQMGGNAVLRLAAGRVLIQDVDGNRFEIPDVGNLSASELKKLDVFL